MSNIKRAFSIRRLLLLPAALLVVATSFPAPAPALAQTTVNITLSVPATVIQNPCSPEAVVLSGDLHLVIHVTEDNRGGYHMEVETNTEGLSGTGLTTGVSYRASETTGDSWYAGVPFPSVYTSTKDTELLSQGDTDNFLMHFDLHVTVNADGVLSALVDNLRAGCYG